MIQVSKRWIAILLCSFGFLFGQYAFQDLATDQIYYKQQFKWEIKNFQFFFANMNSITLILTSLTAPFIGIMCDRFGSNLVLLGHQLIKLIASVFTMSSIMGSYPNMLFASKVSFNVMNGQTGILTAGIVVENFNKHEMAFPNAIVSMLTIMGAGANMLFGPQIVEMYGIFGELFICVIIQAIGFIFYLISYNMGKSMKHQQEENEQSNEQAVQIQIENHRIPSAQTLASSQNLDELMEEIQNNHNHIEQEKSYIQKLKGLNTEFWMAALIYATFNVVYQSIDNYGNMFVIERWELGPKQAAAIESLFPFITFTLPFIGILVDKNSHKTFQMFTLCMALLASSIFLLIFVNPGCGFLLFGLSNAFRLSLILPVLSSVIADKRMIATGNALLKCLSNFFGFCFQLGVGYSYLYTGSYYFMAIACFGLGLLATVMALVLYVQKSMVKNSQSGDLVSEGFNNLWKENWAISRKTTDASDQSSESVDTVIIGMQLEGYRQ